MEIDAKKNVYEINTGTMVRFILVILFFAAIYYLSDLVFVIISAVVIASAIEPATQWFGKKLKVPRLPAVILIYLMGFLGFIAILYSFVPLIIGETLDMIARAPRFINSFDSMNSFGGIFSGGVFQGITETVPVSGILSQLNSIVTDLSGSILTIFSKIFGGAMSFVLTIVISFYLSVQKNGIEDFLKVVTPIKHEKYILNLWSRSRKKIGRWMQGQIILGAIVAILVYLGLTILGVRNALLLAVLAGTFELIPLFGPVLAGIPAISIAFLDGGITLAVMVFGLYLIIQQFENHLIYPLVVKKVVGVPALVVIIALIIGAKFAGLIGMLLSVPIASVLMEYANDMDEKKKKIIAGLRE